MPTGTPRKVLSATVLGKKRQELGLTQDDLAAMAGVGRSTLRNVEQDREDTNPSVELFLRCAVVLGCPLEELVEESWWTRSRRTVALAQQTRAAQATSTRAPRSEDSATKLGQKRRDAHLHQHQLAAKAGIKLRTLCDIELTRNQNPRIELLIRCAVVLGCPLKDLVEESWSSRARETAKPASGPAAA